MHPTRHIVSAFVAFCVLSGIAIAPALSKTAGGDQSSLATAHPPNHEQTDPGLGIYYEKYEPTFYTGFAPRGLDPSRLHIHLGRGNQIRATLVLSDEMLLGYARDLLVRYDTYKALINDGRLVLTQNHGFAAFEEELKNVEIERLVEEESALSESDIKKRNLELMERLNPGRVFRISMDVDEVVRRWLSQVRPDDPQKMSMKRQLQLLNLMLPTRLWIAELNPDVSRQLKELVRVVNRPEQPEDSPAFDQLRQDFLRLFVRVTGGRYPVVDDALVFNEFTAIYPNGSFNDYATHQGSRIPMFPTPGRRALTTHQRTKTVDHIPTVPIYSYSPWLPYMHVGDRLHNSFHTLWWRMEPQKASFLPDEMRSPPINQDTGKPYRYYWLLSRGPMSHGCTHVNTGHINELRQLLPAVTERMYEVDVFLNRSHQFDVFDINGDFVPEVMGVKYFVAYSLQNKKPHRLRAPMERRAFYDWLYGGALAYDDQGRAYFPTAKDAKFVGRIAVDGTEYRNIPLYEAEYEPQRLQFYQMVDIPFARELRKVGDGHQFSH